MGGSNKSRGGEGRQNHRGRSFRHSNLHGKHPNRRGTARGGETKEEKLITNSCKFWRLKGAFQRKKTTIQLVQNREVAKTPGWGRRWRSLAGWPARPREQGKPLLVPGGGGGGFQRSRQREKNRPVNMGKKTAKAKIQNSRVKVGGSNRKKKKGKLGPWVRWKTKRSRKLFGTFQEGK